MEYFKIQIEGNQFAQAYLIYIIEVRHPNYDTHYYVGQTGDRNHRTARPAFRRLGGHLSDQGHSTENQLYRAIVSKILGLEKPKRGKFDAEVKSQVSNFLKASTIEMHAFPLREFQDDCTPELHKENREFIEAVENEIIHRLISGFGESKVLNKRKYKAQKVLKYGSTVDEIFSIAGLNG
ncbi:hypothetical protein SYJ56_19325 [Algoriphagus sp. D3-2-R+10]|uniref:hypothetical protein n=1 Tax=Algoriphagus aurantiacus TaxID=3103948 RepID=UPI002B3D4F66|nr:hypothetical protein [Algoriphagus sp. D3-2-R+10]MEB2777475.1 hypothetical protein [Algoriphagus sp. D3-2-R+10]